LAPTLAFPYPIHTKEIFMMNIDLQHILASYWDEVKTKLKAHHPSLTEEDLSYIRGRDEELFLRLEKRLGKTTDEIKEELRKF